MVLYNKSRSRSLVIPTSHTPETLSRRNSRLKQLCVFSYTFRKPQWTCYIYRKDNLNVMNLFVNLMVHRKMQTWYVPARSLSYYRDCVGCYRLRLFNSLSAYYVHTTRMVSSRIKPLLKLQTISSLWATFSKINELALAPGSLTGLNK